MALLGFLYTAIGVVFAWPTSQVRAWRLAAWGVSAALYALHIGYERLAIGSSSLRSAMRVSLAAALGGMGLAAAAIIHSFSVESYGPHRRLLYAALILFPVVTGLPAFLVALVTGEVLARMQRTSRR